MATDTAMVDRTAMVIIIDAGIIIEPGAAAVGAVGVKHAASAISTGCFCPTVNLLASTSDGSRLH